MNKRLKAIASVVAGKENIAMEVIIPRNEIDSLKQENTRNSPPTPIPSPVFQESRTISYTHASYTALQQSSTVNTKLIAQLWGLLKAMKEDQCSMKLLSSSLSQKTAAMNKTFS